MTAEDQYIKFMPDNRKGFPWMNGRKRKHSYYAMKTLIDRHIDITSHKQIIYKVIVEVCMCELIRASTVD